MSNVSDIFDIIEDPDADLSELLCYGIYARVHMTGDLILDAYPGHAELKYLTIDLSRWANIDSAIDFSRQIVARALGERYKVLQENIFCDPRFFPRDISASWPRQKDFANAPADNLISLRNINFLDRVGKSGNLVSNRVFEWLLTGDNFSIHVEMAVNPSGAILEALYNTSPLKNPNSLVKNAANIIH